MPKLAAYFHALEERGVICADMPEGPGEIWLSLLVGDLQVRRATGALGLPVQEEVRARSARAAALTLQLCGAKKKPGAEAGF
ncbi:hypothetical protein [Agrobacterium sp. V1]|uniref:hypothetical protein n=1 Tax=Agrobacterium sp. V1 TaxID=3061957 RepID=UPI0026737E19|nr:hypothetical protein [Agrobacterium sp. V1]MDO3442220.1 hypothetical protein [Agrobacterium sp. V1]